VDDFLEAYFGESTGDEFGEIKNIKPDHAPVLDQIKYQDGFKVFKVLDNGSKEEY